MSPSEEIAMLKAQLREADQLLRIAHSAHQKLHMEGQGSSGLAHEVRMFALHFSRAEMPHGDGRFAKYWAWRKEGATIMGRTMLEGATPVAVEARRRFHVAARDAVILHERAIQAIEELEKALVTCSNARVLGFNEKTGGEQQAGIFSGTTCGKDSDSRKLRNWCSANCSEFSATMQGDRCGAQR